MKFDSYHPMINLIYFVAVIVCTICFEHPIFLGISFVCAFAYSVKLNGWKYLVLNLCLLLLAFGYSIWYACYHHFGVTNIRENFIGNQITVEALVYGLVRGLIVATLVMWFCCIFKLITMDKVVYLLGRIFPKLSLFLSIIFRLIPKIQIKAKCIEISREGIGKGIRQGNIFQRVLHLFSLISTLITWGLEDIIESSNSMKCRGYSLKGRTSFSIYRFDNRDRGLVIVFFWCLTFMMMAVLLNQTSIYYDPVIIMNKITPLSYVFYVIYTMFLLLPMGLQIRNESVFLDCKKQRVL